MTSQSQVFAIRLSCSTIALCFTALKPQYVKVSLCITEQQLTVVFLLSVSVRYDITVAWGYRCNNAHQPGIKLLFKHAAAVRGLTQPREPVTVDPNSNMMSRGNQNNELKVAKTLHTAEGNC